MENYEKKLDELFRQFQEDLIKIQDSLSVETISSEGYNHAITSRILFFLFGLVGKDVVIPYIINLLNTAAKVVYSGEELREIGKKRADRIHGK